MSVALQKAVVDHLRATFTRQEVADVRPYAGEFSAAEVQQLSYTCPALLVSVLGWKPGPSGKHLVGRNVRAARVAVFVATKHVDRTARMQAAMVLAERAGLALRAWVPASPAGYTLAPLEQEPTCENLYSRDIDAKGQALWLVDWTQDVQTTLPAAQLVDLLAVEIHDHVLGARVPDAAAPAPAPLGVTEQIEFVPQPPNNP